MGVQEIDTLVNLLDDPDTVVYGAVASRFLEQGRSTIPYLEKVWTQNTNAKVRERIEHIIQQIHLREVSDGLYNWINNAHHNLLEGAYWVAKQQYPGLRLSQLQAPVDDILKDIWVGISQEDLPVFNKLNIFNQLFYRTHLFANIDDPLKPTYCFINRVLETKCGNAVSLGILYLYLGQQAGLPLYGVCSPDTFLLAYTNSAGEVLCYINPFNKGAWTGKEALSNYFRQREITPREEYYVPCDNITVLLRLIEYTAFTYEQENNTAQANVYRSFVTLFGKRTSYFLNENE